MKSEYVFHWRVNYLTAKKKFKNINKSIYIDLRHGRVGDNEHERVERALMSHKIGQYVR